MKFIHPENNIAAINTNLFADKAPKGFGKFFGEESADKKSDKQTKNESNEENKPSKSAEPEKKENDLSKPWVELFFKEKTESSDSGGKKGSPIGGGEGNSPNWGTIGMLAAAIVIGGITHYTYKYREITWKEFTT